MYVLGNHEFYHSEYYSAKLSLKNFIKENGFNNIYILDNDVFEYSEYVLIGSTLWTDLGGRNPIVMNSARIVMNDYKVMWYNDSKLSVYNTLDFHSHSLDFIQKFLEKYKDKSIIMLTHHAPSYESRDKRICNGYDDFFCSNLEQIVYDNPNIIIIWLHGDTHYKTTYYINNCLVQTNPKGYPGQFNDFKVKTIQLK